MSYETIELSPGEQRRHVIGDGESFSDVLIDQTADGSMFSIVAQGDNWEIKNVGWKGVSPTGSARSYTFLINVSGNGLIENVFIDQRNHSGGKGSDVGGIWTFSDDHDGHIECRHNFIAGCGNNACYDSGDGWAHYSGTGTVSHYRSYHRDNTPSCYRPGKSGVHMEECVAVANDPDGKRGPYPANTDSQLTRAVWAWHNPNIVAQNCAFYWSPDDVSPANPFWATYRDKSEGEYCELILKDCDINDSWDASKLVGHGGSPTRRVEFENLGNNPSIDVLGEGVPLNPEMAANGYRDLPPELGTAPGRGHLTSDYQPGEETEDQEETNQGDTIMQHGVAEWYEEQLYDVENWLGGEVDIVSTTHTAGMMGINGITWPTEGETKAESFQRVFGESDRRLCFHYHHGGERNHDYSKAASGGFNEVYRNLGQTLVSLGMADTIVRPSAEFNLDWGRYPNDPVNYAEGFANLVREMQSVEGANFTFLYSPGGRRIGYADECWPVQYDFWPEGEEPPIVGPSFYDVSPIYQNVEQPGPEEWERAWNEEHLPRLQMWLDFAQERNAEFCAPEWGVGTLDKEHASGGDNPYYIRKVFEFLKENDAVFQTYWNKYASGGGTMEIFPGDRLLDSREEFRSIVNADLTASNGDTSDGEDSDGGTTEPSSWTYESMAEGVHTEYPYELVIEHKADGEEAIVSYEIEFDGNVEAGEFDYGPVVDGSVATGQLGPARGLDNLYFDGDIVRFEVENASHVRIFIADAQAREILEELDGPSEWNSPEENTDPGDDQQDDSQDDTQDDSNDQQEDSEPKTFHIPEGTILKMKLTEDIEFELDE